jgi:TM2 domain-containing membrane protein YozV
MQEQLFKPTGHSLFLGYLFWVLGFTGAHRFYYGKKWTGLIWFSTFGMFGIGWIVDAFLLPEMDREAEVSYVDGPYNYNIAWLLLTFLGVLGVHRFYMGKIGTGILYFFTGGLLTIGWAYDLWNLNEMISRLNQEKRSPVTIL